MIAELMQSFDVVECFRVNLIRVDIAVQAANFFAVFRHLEPTQDHRLIDFEMKLKGIDVGFVAKRLINTGWRRRQMRRAVGNVEGVAVPLKELFVFSKFREQWIALFVL